VSVLEATSVRPKIAASAPKAPEATPDTYSEAEKEKETFMGPIGWIAFAADSYSRSTTGKSLVQQMTNS